MTSIFDHKRSKLPLTHAPVIGSQAPPEQWLQSLGSRPANNYPEWMITFDWPRSHKETSEKKTVQITYQHVRKLVDGYPHGIVLAVYIDDMHMDQRNVN